MTLTIRPYIMHIFLAHLIIFVLMEYTYVHTISTLYYYYGFTYVFSLNKYLLSKVIYLVYLYFLFKQYGKSDFIFAFTNLFGIFILQPNLILYEYMHDFKDMMMFYNVFFIFFVMYFSSKKVRFKFYRISERKKNYILFLLILLLLFLFVLTYGFNININILFLEEIYETRSEFNSSNNKLTAYLFVFTSKILLPLSFIYFFSKKKYLLSGFIILSMLYLVLISGHKSSLALLIFIIIIYFLGKSSVIQLKKFLYILISLYIFGLLLNIFLNAHIIESLFIRRNVFLPVLISDYYFDFFQDKHIYYAHSFMKSFIDYPYGYIKPPYLIADIYFGRPNMSAVTGIVANAYMNMGDIGVILIIVLTSIILLYFNSLHLRQEYIVPISFILINMIKNTAFTTMLLTGGLVGLIFLGYFIFSEGKPKIKNFEQKDK